MEVERTEEGESGRRWQGGRSRGGRARVASVVFLRSCRGFTGRPISYMRRGHGGWCAVPVHEEEDRTGSWALGCCGQEEAGSKEDGLKEEIGQKELLPPFFPLPEFGNLARDKKRRDRLKI